MLRLTSTAFEDGGTIPTRHTCEGEDLSPPLSWERVPEGAASLALVVEDPDAPSGTFTHWAAWDLDPAAGIQPEGLGAPTEGRNDFSSDGWRGPCPPRGHGPHRYVFRLYALDCRLGLGPGADAASLQEALGGHVLASARLTGIFERR